MQKNKIHILSTRPVDKGLVHEAAKFDIELDEISFIETEAIIDEALAIKIKSLLQQKLTVVFTSMNAVDAVSKFITATPAWKIYCIGNTTKNLVKKYFGDESITATAENAAHLADEIVSDATNSFVTFFCGDKRREDLPEKLKSNKISVNEIIVYRTKETAEIINKIYDGILFYSPSAVNSFLSKNKIVAQTKLFAIGSTTADALQQFTQQPVTIATHPGKENLVKLAIDHFSKSKIS
ncbi:MAG: uroporphyrinogen-III synthase [Bacteroidota bacterium]|nr:uroporphyrinogen-III synthase [Bacteroidota bacterium]